MAKLNDQWFAAAQGMDYDRYIPTGPGYGIYGPRLLCPVCGCEYVHPVAVECLPAGQSKSRVTITNDGLMVQPTEGTYGLRGVVIRLQFCCEQGHEFFYRLRFHEGNTFIERQAWKSPDIDAVQTIWRD